MEQGKANETAIEADLGGIRGARGAFEAEIIERRRSED